MCNDHYCFLYFIILIRYKLQSASSCYFLQFPVVDPNGVKDHKYKIPGKDRVLYISILTTRQKISV